MSSSSPPPPSLFPSTIASSLPLAAAVFDEGFVPAPRFNHDGNGDAAILNRSRGGADAASPPTALLTPLSLALSPTPSDAFVSTPSPPLAFPSTLDNAAAVVVTAAAAPAVAAAAAIATVGLSCTAGGDAVVVVDGGGGGGIMSPCEYMSSLERIFCCTTHVTASITIQSTLSSSHVAASTLNPSHGVTLTLPLAGISSSNASTLDNNRSDAAALNAAATTKLAAHAAL
mmetsp:Transcript_1936/g.4248  ORF Transcript_1936/g.4248 Transcript_1936/m.4248 type:complete len:229 (-) Transcript_1936:664-1350(-)